MSWETAAVVAAGFLGAATNAVAGGGTLITFPTLIWLGVPAIPANATSAVALWPGGVSAAWGFRREFFRVRPRALVLGVASLVGGGAGAWLLLSTPSRLFDALAPWLVLAAALLLALEPLGTRVRSARLLPAFLGFVLIALYGGYFGAGTGMLLLAALGLAGVTDMHERNALKNLFTVAVKGVAVAWFCAAGTVAWGAGLPMLAGALAGGWAGSRLQYRLGRENTRRAVVALGVLMALALLAR